MIREVLTVLGTAGRTIARAPQGKTLPVVIRRRAAVLAVHVRALRSDGRKGRCRPGPGRDRRVHDARVKCLNSPDRSPPAAPSWSRDDTIDRLGISPASAIERACRRIRPASCQADAHGGSNLHVRTGALPTLPATSPLAIPDGQRGRRHRDGSGGSGDIAALPRRVGAPSSSDPRRCTLCRHEPLSRRQGARGRAPPGGQRRRSIARLSRPARLLVLRRRGLSR